MGWKTKGKGKDAVHFNTDKKVRDISDDDGVEVNVNVDVNEDELEQFASQKAADAAINKEFDSIINNISVRFEEKKVVPLFRDEDTKTGYIGDRMVYDGIVTYKGKTKHFEYTDSVVHYNEGVEPNPKDLLYSLIMDYYSPDDEQDFYDEYGYDPDSKRAEKIYKAVVDEKRKIDDLFDREDLEILQMGFHDY
jgi:hypothetical protein